ncbi:MAG: hypothetical protein ACP5MZ_01330 [Candidatus Micrarchaeia archaeon]
MKKTKYRARALGIIIAISVLLPILYGAVSYGQIYMHAGGAPVIANHINSSNPSGAGTPKGKVNSSAIGSAHGSNVQFLNRTAIDAANITSTSSSNSTNYGSNNYSLVSKPNPAMPYAPMPVLLNKTVFIRNATVASQSTYLRGSNYLILKTVSIAYSNYTFNISRVSYVKLTAEASQRDSGILVLKELPPSNVFANESQQSFEMNGTNATISGIYSPGQLLLSIGNMNTTNRIAVQIWLNITPVPQ